MAFAPVSTLRTMLDLRRIGSVELVELMARRVHAVNPQVNAVCQLDLERARSAARRFDSRPSGARSLPLDGIPMTVKESFEVEGLVSTRGLPQRSRLVSSRDATAVARLRAAGAIVLGTTNVPRNLADHQSYNDIYGTTRNPWNLSRTPGGSSGGSAAAVACGLSPVELAGDHGGSIRVPAHFCGVLGHRPTTGLVPLGSDCREAPSLPLDIAVAGPMARSAADLSLLFDLLAGPDERTARGWHLALPPPRATTLRGLRVASWLHCDDFPVDRQVTARLEAFAAELQRAGAVVQCCAPEVDPLRMHGLYRRMIRAATSAGLPDIELQRHRDMATSEPGGLDDEIRGVVYSHREWLLDAQERHRIAWSFRELFTRFDVLICPVYATTAFEHQQEPDFRKRSLCVDDRSLPYSDRLFWSAPAGLAGLPSTVVPVGCAADGMPVGVQLLAPAYDDRTTLHLATLIEREIACFEAPPREVYERGGVVPPGGPAAT
jgi:amidase